MLVRVNAGYKNQLYEGGQLIATVDFDGSQVIIRACCRFGVRDLQHGSRLRVLE